MASSLRLWSHLGVGRVWHLRDGRARGGWGASAVRDANKWHFCAEPAGDAAAGVRRHAAAECGVCGRTILIDERTTRFRVEERLVEVCPLCKESLLEQGYSRAA